MPFNKVETTNEAPPKPAVPLTEQLSTFCTETLGTLADTPSLGICKEIIEQYRTTLKNLVFWYDKWDMYRDYSAVINASLALGRWGASTALFTKMPGYDSDADLQKIGKESDKLGGLLWGAIRMASARLVPYNENESSIHHD
jgi:hypothetical protein